jgi:hypothetical protein
LLRTVGTKVGNRLPKLSRNAGGRDAKLATFNLLERHKSAAIPLSLGCLPFTRRGFAGKQSIALRTHGIAPPLPPCFLTVVSILNLFDLAKQVRLSQPL